jgi:hypothetical protein
MLTCSVCGEQNEDLAVTCRHCHSFLQNRVDAIDLFATIWGLTEHPKATFRKIVLSRHKNYVLLLCMILGVAFAVALFSHLNIGRRVENLTPLVAIALLAGPIAGIALAWAAAILAKAVGRVLGGKGSIRNLRSVLAYATFPLAFSFVFVFPVKFGVFGRYLFDANPSPSVINPTVYYALLTFDVIAAAWACILGVIGVAIAHSFTWWKGAVTMAVLLLILIGVAVAFRGV